MTDSDFSDDNYDYNYDNLLEFKYSSEQDFIKLKKVFGNIVYQMERDDEKIWKLVEKMKEKTKALKEENEALKIEIGLLKTKSI